MRVKLLLALSVGLVALLAAGLFLLLPAGRQYQFHGSILQKPQRVGEIFLRSSTGPVQLRDYSGKLLLLYFGYTSCPDVCPASLAKLKASIDQLSPAEAAQVQVIFISVDPGRDTPKRLDEYAHAFSPSFIGASGTRPEIDLVTDSLGVYYRIGPPDAGGSYTVEHSSYIYVVDRQGYLVMNWSHDAQPDEMVSDLRHLLQNGIPISAQLLAGPTYTPVVCSLTLVPAHVQGGQWLYEHHCAQCHGFALEGNPAWQTELSDGSHLPPPLDSSGRIWQYSEAELIELIKSGRNPDHAIHMPAFKGQLSDWEIHFILQYAASKWDVNQRNYQAGFFTLTPQPTVRSLPSSTPTPLAP